MLRRAVAGSLSGAAILQAGRFLTMERDETRSFKDAVQQFLLFDAMRFASALARQRHDRDCADFAAVQAELLRARIEVNQHTAFGVEHGFSDILRADDFVAAYRERMPLTTGADYQPWVARIAAGEASVLNVEGESMLAATSGTSGFVTLLPNTPTMSREFFVCGILVVFDSMRRAVPSAFGLQRTAKLAFAPSWRSTDGGLRVGPNSSGPKDKSFRRLLPLYTTPGAGFTISDDEDAAMYVHALYAARDRSLGIIEANFITLPHRLLLLLQREGHRIAADIESGTLDAGVASRLPPDTVAALDAALGGSNPVRAAEIRAALAVEEPNGLARRLWPRLQLVLANATGAFEAYARRLLGDGGDGCDGVLAGVPILSTVLAASEGLMGVSLQPQLDGGASYCLVPRAMFFEFLPAPMVREDGSESPAIVRSRAAARAVGEAEAAERLGRCTLLAHELEVGRDYELVCTTLGGLCRYRIGDVVKVVGFHGGAPLVEFGYRKGQLLNVRGEKTSEPQLADALRASFPAGGGPLEYTCVEVTEAHPPRYSVLVELPEGSSLPPNTGARLDSALRVANPVYSSWRAKGAIGECEVQQVGRGAFEELRRRRIREGASPQQLKISRVDRDESHLALLRRHGHRDVSRG